MVELCERGGEIDCGSRFADTALLICDGYRSSHLLQRRTVAQSGKGCYWIVCFPAGDVSRETSRLWGRRRLDARADSTKQPVSCRVFFWLAQRFLVGRAPAAPRSRGIGLRLE